MSDAVMNPDALAANRRGELSEQQVRNMGAWSTSKRRSALSTAAYLVAGAAVVGFFASPTASPVLRAAIVGGCLTIAIVLIVRSLTGTDAFTQDVKEGRVESIEGAIGKHHLAAPGGPAATAYFVEVGDTRFTVDRSISEAVPDAGSVRLYFLPRSRKIVNCERLVSARMPDTITPQAIGDSLRTFVSAHNRRERNEARAEMADLADAFDEAVSVASARPPGAGDPRRLQRDIIGTWRNAMMTARFSADGVVAVTMFGTNRDGRWSVDTNGRLTSDITGRPETVDGWIADNQLTIVADGQSLVFTRDSGA